MKREKQIGEIKSKSEDYPFNKNQKYKKYNFQKKNLSI